MLTPFDRRGFVLPVTLFAMVIMTVVAVAALATSALDRQASHNFRLSYLAELAAENATRQVMAGWSPIYDTLSPGNIYQTVVAQQPGHGAIVSIMRLDNDTSGDVLYALTAEGYEPRGAHRTVQYLVTRGTGLTFGQLGTAAATVRGDITVKTFDGYGGGEATIEGKDRHPVNWPTCPPGPEMPGVVYDSGAVLIEDGGSTFQGDPPTLEAQLTDTTFSMFGEMAWADFRALADHTVGCVGCFTDLNETDIYPRYHPDGTCDTSHPYNWGSAIKPDACADYMPIILIQGEVDINRVYGQGIFVLDWDPMNTTGSEFDIEQNVTLNGIILGRGCVELQESADVRGTIFVDGTYSQATCSDDATLDVHDGASLSFSSCAIDRVLAANGLGDPATATWMQPLERRAFLEVLR